MSARARWSHPNCHRERSGRTPASAQSLDDPRDPHLRCLEIARTLRVRQPLYVAGDTHITLPRGFAMTHGVCHRVRGRRRSWQRAWRSRRTPGPGRCPVECVAPRGIAVLLILPLHPTRDAEAPSPTEPPRQVTFVQSRKDGLSDKPSPFVRLRLTILLHTASSLSSQKDATHTRCHPSSGSG